MKARLLAAVLSAIGMQAAYAGDATGDMTDSALFRHPDATGGAVDSADLISRVERALSSYAAGCAARDEQAMAEVFTRFAIVAYASEIPGRFIAGDALSDRRCWAADALTGTTSSASPIWIYPTSEPDVVMIQYTAHVGAGSAQHTLQDIALIEMAGDRIAQIRDYAPQRNVDGDPH